MKIILIFANILYYISISSAENFCGDWLAFENEKCVKLFNIVETNENAAIICKNQPNDATLVSITSLKEQVFIENYVFNQSNSVDSVWLGGFRNASQSNQFYWEDGSVFAYTNWDDTHLERASFNCIEMQAEVGFQSVSKLGKWISVSCAKRNLVLCQYSPKLTLTRLQNELNSLKYVYQSLSDKFDAMEKNSSTVPIGFIYSQLPNQSEPTTIWPNTYWQDISSSYSGLFFRVVGGSSDDFGAVQSENSPHLMDVNIHNSNHPFGPTPDTAPTYSSRDPFPISPANANNWTKLISYCYNDSCNSNWHNYFFDFSGGEVRPRNQAIRIWKRVQ